MPNALAGLASTYLLLSSTTIRRPLPVDEAVQLATEAARRALAIDSRQGEAYAVLGRLKMTYDWDWTGAEADLTRAVSLAPRIGRGAGRAWPVPVGGRPAWRGASPR